MLIGDLGEEALLKELRSLFAAAQPDVPTGIGDDAAVISFPPGAEGVWTTDLLIEGVHFRRDWQTPGQLGRKCLSVNLSDIASMGATPRFALLSFACPASTPLDYILEFGRGLAELAAETGVTVIGGDTSGSASGEIIVSIAVGGYVASGCAVLRSGAQPGDSILVTGYLGNAAGGLNLLDAGGDAKYPGLIEAFINPAARLVAAKAASEAGATAMTDISDGLASDLRHICEESGTGAQLRRESLPASVQLEKAAVEHGWDLESMILTGGEDYELLFTLPSDMAGPIKAVIAAASTVPVSIIGEIMPHGYGIQILDLDGKQQPLPIHGFDHFLKND